VVVSQHNAFTICTDNFLEMWAIGLRIPIPKPGNKQIVERTLCSFQLDLPTKKIIIKNSLIPFMLL
jgi:hypothetical protein